MSVSLKFTFSNIEEAQAFLAGKISGTPTQPVAVPATAPAGEGAVSTGAEKAEDSVAGGTGRGGRKGKKAEPAAPAAPAEGDKPQPSGVVPPAAAAPAPAAEQPKLTEAEVRAALLKVSDKFGAEGFSKVAEVLAPFGIQKVKDIKPEQFAEVVAAAEKLAA